MISKMRRCRAITAIRISVGAMLCLLMYGCADFTTNLVSSANIEQSQAHISKAGRLEIGGTVIIIRPANAIYTGITWGIIFPTTTENVDPKDYTFELFYYQNTRLDTRDPFIVEILISTGDHETVFSPMRLGLQGENGIRGYPVRFYTFPPRYSTTRGLNPVTPLCKERGTQAMHMDLASLSRYASESHDPLHLTKDKLYCFAVQFDIPPVDPRSVFKITVNDLSVDGQKMLVPVITYLPDTYNEKLH